jgi:hypothetical protein
LAFGFFGADHDRRPVFERAARVKVSLVGDVAHLATVAGVGVPVAASAGRLPAAGASTVARAASRARGRRVMGFLDMVRYSTVTVLARLRGWSTLRPRATASS